MFHVKTEEEEHGYELSEELSEYANHYMSKYINHKGLKEEILTENPVPTNIDKVKVMDEIYLDRWLECGIISRMWSKKHLMKENRFRLI